VKLDYSLTQSDFLTQAAFELRFVRLPFAQVTWLVWGLFFAALVLVAGDAFAYVLLVAFMAFIIFQTVASLQRRLWLRCNYSADRLRGLAGEQHLEITEEHLRETAPNRDVTWHWQDYSSIHDTPSHVFIKPTPINTVIIPHSVFSSDAARAELVSFVKGCIERKRPNQTLQPTAGRSDA
jgi:hypothetical protein